MSLFVSLIAGHGHLSPSRLPSVRNELLQFLLEDSKVLSSNVFKRFESLNGNFPNLRYLLLLDTEATISVLRHAFPEEGYTISDVSMEKLATSSMEPEANYYSESLDSQKLMAQSTIDVLVSMLDLESDMVRSFSVDVNPEVWPSEKDVGLLFEFIAFLVAYSKATISRRVLKHILEYLTLHSFSGNSDPIKQEKQVVSLLKAVPQTEWDSSYVLHLCARAHFFQA